MPLGPETRREENREELIPPHPTLESERASLNSEPAGSGSRIESL